MKRRTLMLATLAALAAPQGLSAAQIPTLNGPRLPAAKGPARMLVVLCHGFGADGNDLFGLAKPLQSYLPNAAFVSPNGPERVEGGGYRWFDNGPNFGNVPHDVLTAAPALNTFADSELARLKLTPDHLIFIGFSQGATTVLNVGLRRQPRPIAVVAYAGARLSLENLPERFEDEPPVLLCRGSDDPQSRADDMENAIQVLTNRGLSVQSRTFPGLGHGINEGEIMLAGEFLRSAARTRP
jgi:phospholipase/carboxylesterase